MIRMPERKMVCRDSVKITSWGMVMKKCEECETELVKNWEELICENCGAMYRREIDDWILAGWQTQEENET